MRWMIFAVMVVGLPFTNLSEAMGCDFCGSNHANWTGCLPPRIICGPVYTSPGFADAERDDRHVQFSGRVVAVDSRSPARCEILCNVSTRRFLDQRLSLFQTELASRYRGELRVIYTRGNRLLADCIGFDPRIGDRVSETIISNPRTIAILELVEGRTSLARITSIDPVTLTGTARCYVADPALIGLNLVCFRGAERSYLGTTLVKDADPSTNQIAVQTFGELRQGDYIIIYDVLDDFVSHRGFAADFKLNWRVLESGQIVVKESAALGKTQNWDLRNGQRVEGRFEKLAGRWVSLAGTAGSQSYAFEQFNQESLRFAALRSPDFALGYANWLREQDEAIDLFGEVNVWRVPPIAPSNTGPREQIAAYIRTLGPQSVVFEEANNRNPTEFSYAELPTAAREAIFAAVPELASVVNSAPANNLEQSSSFDPQKVSEKRFQKSLLNMLITDEYVTRPLAMLERHLERKAFVVTQPTPSPAPNPDANVALATSITSLPQ